DLPSLNLRQIAPANMQQYLKMFPVPNLPDSVNAAGRATGYAQGVFAVSNPTRLDSTSLRLDHMFKPSLQLFSRYAFSPSVSSARGQLAVNDVFRFNSGMQTFTAGLVAVVSPSMTNDFRFNFSGASGWRRFLWDNYAGGAPLPDSTVFPAGSTVDDSIFSFRLNNGVLTQLQHGTLAHNWTRQFNFVDNYSIVRGAHHFKFGLDFRRLRVRTDNSRTQHQISFTDTGVLTTPAPAGTLMSGLGAAIVAKNVPGGLFFNSWSSFFQDVWKLNSRLTLTYGFRWEINPPPSPETLYVVAFNPISSPSSLSQASQGSPLYSTTYGNLAPRVGLAYQLRKSANWATVLRTGFGMFYDTAYGRLSNFLGTPPFSSFVSLSNIPLPAYTQLANFVIPTAPPYSGLTGVDPALKLPRTYQWNVSIDQQLGRGQNLTISYLGAMGLNLFVGEQFQNLNSAFTGITVIGGNNSYSDYASLQAQYQRRFSRALQALVSYTWAHSLDTASNDTSNFPHTTDYYPGMNRGSSDFDVRQVFTAALVARLPTPGFGGSFGRALMSGWGVDPFFRARTALPTDIVATRNVPLGISTRLNSVPGQALYIDDPILPGGRRFNAAAWTLPTGFVQGTFGRNIVRGLGFGQVDLSVHRDFVYHEKLTLQFRTDFFNVSNHPNFGNPSGTYNTATTFGVPTAMLGRSLNSASAGGFNALYQIGGPRSIQFSLKLLF
ncbi:MAG: TonB-dependent receptor, partial [Candidatus Solibacter usitatus]|nr:TonB-dependent receptor [Candidatus Solibacter usitatus]